MNHKKAKQKLGQAHPAHPLEVLWMHEILDKPIKVIWLNFIAGISRGLGLALGVGLLASAVLVILYKLIAHAVDVPLIGSYLARFITEVQSQLAELSRLRP